MTADVIWYLLILKVFCKSQSGSRSIIKSSSKSSSVRSIVTPPQPCGVSCDFHSHSLLSRAWVGGGFEVAVASLLPVDVDRLGRAAIMVPTGNGGGACAGCPPPCVCKYCRNCPNELPVCVGSRSRTFQDAEFIGGITFEELAGTEVAVGVKFWSGSASWTSCLIDGGVNVFASELEVYQSRKLLFGSFSSASTFVSFIVSRNDFSGTWGSLIGIDSGLELWISPNDNSGSGLLSITPKVSRSPTH